MNQPQYPNPNMPYPQPQQKNQPQVPAPQVDNDDGIVGLKKIKKEKCYWRTK